ncbi:transcriptional regulator, TetR family [Colwellia psychrerythraea 34H]|uniref:Transcriptional regulator, TetR family n=2 Tax=Colwelliaceae TaxID=267889 RepID=Q484U6_COLP3|nr:transcriptional regulator, TetR family [Colwellia psychrerythraea 34H]
MMTAGRHRSFDKDKTLEKAMLVFWKNGYPGTSLTDLTNAMGINKSSLYAAFGNKENLFNQAIEYYLNKHGVVHLAELFKTELSLKERVKNYLFSIANMLTNPDLPKGCLISQSTSEIAGCCLPENSAMNINGINQQTLLTLTEFFEEQQAGRGIDENSPKAIANYLLTLQFGLAISARNGSNLEDLKETINVSLSLFN